MRRMLVWAARIGGAMGALLMAVAVAVRLAGAYWFFGVQVGTLLQAGMAVMLVACFAYIASIAEARTGG